MKQAADRLSRFLFRPTNERLYIMVRIVFASVLLVHILALWPYRLTLFSTDGLLPRDADNTGRYLSLFAFFCADPAIGAYFAFSALAATTLALGLLPRISALACFVWLVSYQQHLSFVGFGGDFVMRVFGFILLISPLGRRSLWGPRDRSPAQAPQYGILLFRLQLALIYLDTAIAKLSSEAWLEGEAISKFMLSVYSVWPPGMFIEWLGFTKLMTYATLLLEFALPVLLFIPKTRCFAIVAGLAFHLAIGIASPFLILFGLAMLPGYVAFLDEDTRRRLGNGLLWRRRGRGNAGSSETPDLLPPLLARRRRRDSHAGAPMNVLWMKSMSRCLVPRAKSKSPCRSSADAWVHLVSRIDARSSRRVR